ncbi:hypothetical protein B0H19DRAFT_901685, partial [Mycena capillaripes]
DIRAVDAEDIKDKSKGDAFSKGIALFQGLWFVTQCIARVRQNLPVTELEIATLAFSFVNILIWGLWWKKPLDVQRPIPVGPQESSKIPEPPIPSNEALDNQGASLLPTEIDSLEGDAMLWQASFLAGIFGALHGGYIDFEPTSYNSVPSFWSSDDREKDDISKGFSLFIEGLVGTVFGAIHCVAWNTDFLSTQEMWMWRSCSVLVAAVPLIFLLVLGVLLGVDDVAPMGAVWFCMITPIYIIARLFLIVLPLVALRATLPGMLMDVNWSVYIPHL